MSVRRPWSSVVVRGARSIAPCVARRSNVAVRGVCGAIDRSVRGPIAVSDRSNVALRGLCGDFCQNSSEPRCGRSLRPIVFSTLVSYRAADVCGPECRQTSLCAVFAKIVFSPTRNTTSNTKHRHLSHDMIYFTILNNTCSRLRETLF